MIAFVRSVLINSRSMHTCISSLKRMGASKFHTGSVLTCRSVTSVLADPALACYCGPCLSSGRFSRSLAFIFSPTAIAKISLGTVGESESMTQTDEKPHPNRSCAVVQSRSRNHLRVAVRARYPWGSSPSKRCRCRISEKARIDCSRLIRHQMLATKRI
jgi:hypothetical protein